MMGTLTQLVIFLGVFLTALEPADANAKSLFVFGDSQVDPGNNQHIKNCIVRANFTPYGLSYFHHPTGRFTNGRTVADFIAQYLGIEFQKPYQEVLLHLAKDPRMGIPPNGLNFASAGSGLLDTNKDKGVASIRDQVQQFQSLIAQKHLHKKQIVKSLYVLAIGSSDVFDYFLLPEKSSSNPRTYVRAMFKELVQFIGKIYKYGGRRFVLSSIGPTGCVPARVAIKDTPIDKCNDKINMMVRYYNAGLKRIVYNIPRMYPRSIAIYGAMYDVAMKYRGDPKSYGFANVTHACCGGGVPLNGKVLCGLLGYHMCLNPNQYLFWDDFHPSEHAYELIAKAFWTGSRKEVWPINLKTLAHTIK